VHFSGNKRQSFTNELLNDDIQVLSRYILCKNKSRQGFVLFPKLSASFFQLRYMSIPSFNEHTCLGFLFLVSNSQDVRESGHNNHLDIGS